MKIKHTRHNEPTEVELIENIVEAVCKSMRGQSINSFLLWSIENSISNMIHDEILNCTLISNEVTHGYSGFYIVLVYKLDGSDEIQTFKTLIQTN